MFTPVHDYMKIVNDDYKVFYKYLEAQYPKKVIYSESNSNLRTLHNILWILYLTKETFNEDNSYFNDLFANILAMINVTIVKDKKSLKFLVRSSIENFLKFSKIFYSEINTTDHPKDLFATIFKNTKEQKEIHEKYEKIKSYYSELSYEIHGNVIKNSKMCTCLKEYENLYLPKEINKEIDKFREFIKHIIFIYFYIFKEKLNLLKGDAIYIVKKFIPTEDLKLLQ